MKTKLLRKIRKNIRIIKLGEKYVLQGRYGNGWETMNDGSLELMLACMHRIMRCNLLDSYKTIGYDIVC